MGKRVLLATCTLLLLTLAACERPDPEVTIAATTVPLILPPTPLVTPFADPAGGSAVDLPPTPFVQPPAVQAVPTYVGTPTPDPTRPGQVGDDGAPYVTHSVAFGETLANIARRYGTTIDELASLNSLENTDFLFVGQEILVPGAATRVGPNFKIVPDSELVYGPAAREFDVDDFVARYGGYLGQHEEAVEGQMLDGPSIVQLVADRYSVNPRILLAALEYRAGWVTQEVPGDITYPMGRVRDGQDGLYKQLGWAANQLNFGYYGRAEGGVTSFTLAETVRVAFAPEINDGTAGVQSWLGAHDAATYETWLAEAAPAGFFDTYSRLFGNPFAYTVDPLWPNDLAQPDLVLPWANGETWYFTGGPHGGWASGSAWAALDFVPENEQLGCYQSDAWVTAMAPGVVVRSDFGAVVVDLDGDGYAGTGWAVLYMHLESRDRIAAGAIVETGDSLGHPSCEGGFSNGTHVHVARTYNGRWVAADGSVPLVMGGWTSQGVGREYDGLLVRGDTVKEACDGCREEGNAVTADS